MDWIPYITSAAALVISSVCAALGYRRTHELLPHRLDIQAEAIEALRGETVVLLTRLRRLEAAARRQKGPLHGP